MCLLHIFFSTNKQASSHVNGLTFVKLFAFEQQPPGLKAATLGFVLQFSTTVIFQQSYQIISYSEWNEGGSKTWATENYEAIFVAKFYSSIAASDKKVERRQIGIKSGVICDSMGSILEKALYEFF